MNARIQPVVLRNVTCAYCSVPFDNARKATKEHVIGRRFVPRGALQGVPNLILRACTDCNAGKSDLEDDISSILLQPDALGRYASADPALPAEAQRKGRGAFSRRTGKPVADSTEQLTLHGQMGPVGISFRFHAAPQLDDERIFALAYYHWRGFFYHLSYDAATQRGQFVDGVFMPLVSARKADWGHPQLAWFTQLTSPWPRATRIVTARDHFKLVIRRHPERQDVWAWAMEWNQNLRVVGFKGSDAAISTLMQEAPVPERHAVSAQMTYRREVPLAPETDTLFAP